MDEVWECPTVILSPLVLWSLPYTSPRPKNSAVRPSQY